MARRQPQRRSHARVAAARRLSPAELAIVLFVLLALFAAAWLSGRPATVGTLTTSVRVRPGDTLWSLAESHRIEGLTTAQTVRIVADLNGIQGGSIAAGDELTLPAELGFEADSALAMR